MFERRTAAERDTDLLSAYLDNQLSASERASVEARLAAEPTLQAELTSLQRTVALVRTLPTPRRKRSFALNARQARHPAPLVALGRAYPILQSATGLVAVMFILLLFGQAALRLPVSLPSASAPQAPLPSNSGSAGQSAPAPTSVIQSMPVVVTAAPEPTLCPGCGSAPPGDPGQTRMMTATADLPSTGGGGGAPLPTPEVSTYSATPDGTPAGKHGPEADDQSADSATAEATPEAASAVPADPRDVLADQLKAATNGVVLVLVVSAVLAYVARRYRWVG